MNAHPPHTLKINLIGFPAALFRVQNNNYLAYLAQSLAISERIFREMACEKNNLYFSVIIQALS